MCGCIRSCMVGCYTDHLAAERTFSTAASIVASSMPCTDVVVLLGHGSIIRAAPSL